MNSVFAKPLRPLPDRIIKEIYKRLRRRRVRRQFHSQTSACRRIRTGIPSRLRTEQVYGTLESRHHDPESQADRRRTTSEKSFRKLGSKMNTENYRRILEDDSLDRWPEQ